MVPGPAGLEEETHPTAEKYIASGNNRLYSIHLFVKLFLHRQNSAFVLMYVM